MNKIFQIFKDWVCKKKGHDFIRRYDKINTGVKNPYTLKCLRCGNLYRRKGS